MIEANGGTSNTQGASNRSGVTTLTDKQTKLIVYVMTLVILVIAGLTLILAFHYPSGSDTTSVLGVVVPIFTAGIGVLVGGGAGVAAGAAGKQSTQAKLTTSTDTMTSLLDQMTGLEKEVATLSGNLHKHLSHSPGAMTLSIRDMKESCVWPLA
jgi:hypothetical protein